MAGLLVAVLWLVVPAAQAQGPDELRERYEEAVGEERAEVAAVLVQRLAHQDPQQGLEIGERELAAARENGWHSAEAGLQVALGVCLNILGRNEEAIERYRAGVDLYRELGDRLGELQGLRSIGISHYDTGRPDRALELYLQALRLAEELGDPLEVGKTASNIGNVHYQQGDPERALPFQEQALAAFEEAGFQIGIAGVSLNLGALYQQRARQAEEAGDAVAHRRFQEQARERLERALEVFRALGIDRGVSGALHSLGRLHARLEEFGPAEAYHREALRLRDAMGDRQGQIQSRQSLGEALLQQGRPEAALEHLEAGLELAREVGAPQEEEGLLASLARAYEGAGRHRDSARAWRELLELRETVAAQEIEERLAELQLRYDDERQARQIEQLEHDRELRELDLRRQKALNWALAGAGGLVLLLLGGLFSRYRLRVRSAEELARVARQDPLTGLSNRRDVLERLEAEHARARRSGERFALVLADLDDFKAINDGHGHHVGDEALVRVAEILRTRCRSTDLAARWGGEEFLLLLPGTDAEGARTVVDEIRRALESRAFHPAGPRLRLTATFGIAEADPRAHPEATVDDWIRAADDALLEGKRQGKDRAVVGQGRAARSSPP